MTTETKIVRDPKKIEELKAKGWKVQWTQMDGTTSMFHNEHGFLRLAHNSSYPKHLIEARNDDGTLNFDGEQPPTWTIQGITDDQLIRKIFWADPNNNDKAGTVQNALAYIASKGWAVRPKAY